MHTPDNVEDHITQVAKLFPNAVTETIKDGKVVQSIDFDVLKQELSDEVVEGPAERYQFTWPDKRKSILLANAPIAKTLRPCREESVDFDTTQNLYIEGDNLDALKLLQETYLGKVKMIYIDPPYNTGNDFVYEDDFAQNTEEFLSNSGQKDEEGGRLVANLESNGRFHTDWLNMIYPRLKLAKDLLTDDGVIFISIDDNEADNLLKCGQEVFGPENFIATFPWRKRTAKSDVPFGISQDYEWIIVFAKSNLFIASVEGKERKYFLSTDYPDRPWRIHDMSQQRTAGERANSFFDMIDPKTGKIYKANPVAVWRVTKDTFQEYYDKGRIIFPGEYDFLNISKPVLRYFKDDDAKKDGDRFGFVAVSTKLPETIGLTQDGTRDFANLFEEKLFGFPKPVSLVQFLIEISTTFDKEAIILDFFSGSATTAQAVMQLNFEDSSKRKFILVQLPEITDQNSEANKAGYPTICEIGKERIRRAGKKIMVEAGDKALNLDLGFRVLKVDSTNMQDIYYSPSEYKQGDLLSLAENIKPDRSVEDLLFQVMLDLGILLSSPIKETLIGGKKVYDVANRYLLACFDAEVNDNTVMEIAKQKPYYAIFRDSSIADDSVAANFEQIFSTYSPTTVRKVI
jgi:adenine-specific DNA-methyltransferase